MRLEFYDVEKLKKEILEIIGRYLNLNEYKVFFFGSRVTGSAVEQSDIDIGIEGLKPVPLAALAMIEEELDNLPILYKIELIDFHQVTEKFKMIAVQKREFITA